MRVSSANTKQMRKIEIGLSFLVTLIGALVMIGWLIKADNIVQIIPGTAPMQFNAALCFFFVGIGMLLYHHLRTPITRVSGVLVFLMGAAVLFEYIARVDLGIDQLIMQHYITVNTSHPGRMAPNTALCFLIVGVVLTLPVARGQTQRIKLVAIAGALLLSLAGLPLVGYIFSFESSSGWGSLTRMAANTCISFILVGIVFLIFARSLDSADNYREVKWLPAVVGVGISALSVLAWESVQSQMEFTTQKQVQQEQNRALDMLTTRLDEYLLALQRMASRYESGSYATPDSWRMDAQFYLNQMVGLESINAYDGKTGQLISPFDKPQSPPFSLISDLSLNSNSNPLQLNSSGDATFLMARARYGGKLAILAEIDLHLVVNQLIGSQADKLLIGPAAKTHQINRMVGNTPIAISAWTTQQNQTPGWPYFILLVGLGLAVASFSALSLMLSSIQAKKEALRKQAKLRNKVRALQQANASLEQFTYLASHDLKAPVRQVVSFVQLARRRLEGHQDPSVDDFLNRAQTCGTELAALIDKLLELSRAGRIDPAEQTSINNETLIRNIETDAKERYPNKIILIKIQEGIPDCFGVPRLIEQLWGNLIDNAIKFNEGASIPVSVGFERRGEQTEFYIRDKGTGLSARQIAEMFQPFRRASKNTNHTGSGLGLALCSRIVSAHGGQIWADSQPGEGTTVYFTLPKPVKEQ